jgi:hypothetical protein
LLCKRVICWQVEVEVAIDADGTIDGDARRSVCFSRLSVTCMPRFASRARAGGSLAAPTMAGARISAPASPSSPSTTTATCPLAVTSLQRSCQPVRQLAAALGVLPPTPSDLPGFNCQHDEQKLTRCARVPLAMVTCTWMPNDHSPFTQASDAQPIAPNLRPKQMPAR